MSRLEKFISDHREDFDDEEPSEKLWQKIEASVSKKNRISVFFRPVIKWSVAAAILVFAATGVFLGFNKKNGAESGAGKTNDSLATAHSSNTVEEAPEINQFARLITLKQEELKVLAKEQPLLYQKFTVDVDRLESSYNTLKKQLSVTPNREVLIEAMIQNLELQLSVLNQQLNIIQQIKQSKKYSHEKNKSFT